MNNFLTKFKNFNVIFLVDTPDCKLRHEFIPILQAIIKNNPVEEFVNNYFPGNEIVAYDVYKITREPNEIVHVSIMSTSYGNPLSQILEYILDSKYLHFSGIYFLSLEFRNVIDRIISQDKNNLEFAEHLQIFVTYLSVSGLKIISKHRDQVITIDNAEYPQNKSANYIAGFIEQKIRECLDLLKNYTTNPDIKILVLFLLPKNLELLLRETKATDYIAKFIETDDLGLKVSTDSLILRLLDKKREFLAFNNNLKQLQKLNIINFLVTKPSILVLLMLCIFICFSQVDSLQTYKKLVNLHQKKYNLEEEYHKIKQQYPYIRHAPNLASLYAIEELLRIPISTPFVLLKKLLLHLGPRLQVTQINWQRSDIDNILLVSDQYIHIKISMRLLESKMSMSESLEYLKKNVEKLRNSFPDKDIILTIFHEYIVELSGQVIIPMDIIVKDYSPLNPNNIKIIDNNT